jgi:hypothetical protein
VGAWWGRRGDGEEMRRRKERLWLNRGRRMRYRWTAGRASVNFTASDARSRALPKNKTYPQPPSRIQPQPVTYSSQPQEPRPSRRGLFCCCGGCRQNECFAGIFHLFKAKKYCTPCLYVQSGCERLICLM